MGKVYQSCYTNATQEVGSVISSGWQTVAASPGLPPEAGKMCAYLQNLNSSITSQMLDEKGQVLNLYEISGDEKYAYVMRTQYGLVDRVGRPNMFSHAYIFPFDDPSVLSDPNSLLSIDRSNFKTRAEDVAAWDGQFVRQVPLSLDGSLQAAGMDRERYTILVRCVYAQMNERKSPRPLYIQYDGSEPQLRAILYCVYYGIPYYMRKRLSVASCPAINDGKKNLIFTCNAKSRDRFFIPQTGETNILDSRIQRKIDRYGYIDYAAKRLAAVEFPAFFENLEQIAVSLGDSSASNELVLKVAYQCYNHSERGANGQRTINFNAFSDEELESCLSDALRSGLYTSVYMGSQIAYLLSNFSHRGLNLSEANEETLDEWVASSDNSKLRQAGLDYRTHKLRTLPPDKAVDRLFDMPEETFKLYTEELLKSSDGEELLDRYFSRLGGQDMSWEQIKNLWNMSGSITSRRKTTDAVQAAAWRRYCEDVANGEDVRSSYQNYSELMRSMLCPDRLTETAQYYDCLASAKEEFWRHQSMSTFRFQDRALYEFMRSASAPAYDQFMDLIRLADDYDPLAPGRLLNKVFQFFSSQNTLTSGGKENAVHELAQYLSKRCDEDYVNWVRVFAEGTGPADEGFNELLSCIRALHNNTVHFDAQELIQSLKSFLLLEQKDAVKKQVCDMVEAACAANDASSAPVPLDLWLLLSMWQPNCFDVITRRKPKIIGADPASVVRESELLKDPGYQDAAQQYIKKSDGKCPETKAVKCWINECRQAEKGKRAEGWPFSSKKAKSDASTQADSIWPIQEAQDSEGQSAAENKAKGKGLRGLFGKR